MLAWITHPVFALHETGPGHPECGERIGAIEDALAAALAERAQQSGRGVLLLVDQLEELVTLMAPPR